MTADHNPAYTLSDQGRVAAPDIFAEDGPTLALRPATIRHQTEMIKRFASELIHAEVPVMQLDSVAVLCDPRRAELPLRAMVARNDGINNAVIADMAVLLCTASVWASPRSGRSPNCRSVWHDRHRAV